MQRNKIVDKQNRDTQSEFDNSVSLENILFEYKYLQSLRRVVRGITHNYNNIFAGAMGHTPNCSRNTASPSTESPLPELIERAVKETETLFGFARLDGPEREERSLDGIIHRTVQTLNAISPSVTVAYLESGETDLVTGKLSELILMFFYIAENGIEAINGAGKITFNVSRKKSVNESLASVTITDNGPGIDPSILPDLFNIKTSQSKNSPYGLGLYLARQIALKHGGDIILKNSTPTGTSFEVNLPIVKKISKSLTSIPESTNTANGPSPERKQIFFIIDDDDMLVQFLVAGLQKKGHIVFSAKDCAEALDEYRLVSEIVTVFLVDIGLIDCDGFECVEQLRQINDGTRVIFMSGDTVYGKNTIPQGTSFIEKPFTVKKLEELVNDATA